MTKKNVLIISAVFYPEPIVSANLLTQLASALTEKYNVTVLRPHPTRPKGFVMPEYDYSSFTFKVIEIDSYTCAESSLMGRYKETISMGKKCANYILNNNQDINFVFNDCWHLWGVNLVAKACVKHNIPYMTSVQDIYPESLFSKLPKIKLLQWVVTKLLGPIDLYTLKNAARIHTISHKMVDHLSTTRNLSKNKFVVVRNWQNEEDFIKFRESHQDDNNNGIFTFMYLGNVGPLAGIGLLFEALRTAQLKNARLVIAGSGSEKDNLIQKAKEYNDCKIEFWDVPFGKVPATQAKADVMCLPVKKGFAMSSIPSKLPAYMFSAKPVIASVDVESDTALCVRSANAGWVANPEDVNDLACCMKEAYTLSKQQLLEMGQRGLDYSCKIFSRKNNLPILVNVCIELIENNDKLINAN